MTGFYTHPQALCESKHIGSGTRVWAFAHILPGAVVGKDCNICDHVFIENDVVLGDRVTVKCGVQIWDGIRIEDDVFVGPNATFTNDKFPRSKAYLKKFPQTVLRKGASVGANATLLPGITIGSNSMIGAGAVVTGSVPENAIVVGNPARIVGYVDSGHRSLDKFDSDHSTEQMDSSTTVVNGVTVHRLGIVKDLRGNLSVGEFSRQVPFVPKRYFLVFDVPSAEVRGQHAHKECHQFLVCIKGSCSALADDGQRRAEFLLDRPSIGLYLPPKIWGVQYKYTHDAVLLVFASEFYDADDYIRNYDDFLAFARNR